MCPLVGFELLDGLAAADDEFGQPSLKTLGSPNLVLKFPDSPGAPRMHFLERIGSGLDFLFRTADQVLTEFALDEVLGVPAHDSLGVEFSGH